VEFRDTRPTDVDALFEVRSRTRQNPLSRESLARLGITPQSAAADPAVRAHGFYRKLGWHPTGERTTNGDEILQLPPI